MSLVKRLNNLPLLLDPLTENHENTWLKILGAECCWLLYTSYTQSSFFNCFRRIHIISKTWMSGKYQTNKESIMLVQLLWRDHNTWIQYILIQKCVQDFDKTLYCQKKMLLLHCFSCPCTMKMLCGWNAFYKAM